MTGAAVGGRDYRILGSLGAGGMGEIFLASAHGASGFTKVVVLKTMKPELYVVEKAREMFLQEARVAARLNHPNVIQVYEVTSLGKAPALVMEYLEGHAFSSCLSRAMARGTNVPLGLGLRVVVDALRGLHCAHELKDFDGTPLNLIHRDVSPQNIVVTYDGQVKLLDFGVAKIDATAIKTGRGEIKGKIRYMSPEQLAGKPFDRRADIYAMGCVLWEIATGSWIWKDAGDAALVAQVMAGRIPPPRSVNPAAHPQLSSIVMKAMALDPAQRYASCTELRTDLETYLANELHGATHEMLGAYVATQFEEVRARRAQFIQAQLREGTMRAAAASFPEGALPVPRAERGPSLFPKASIPAPAPAADAAPAAVVAPEDASQRTMFLLLGAVILAVLVATMMGALLAGLYFTRAKRASHGASDASVAVTASASPSASSAPSAEELVAPTPTTTTSETAEPTTTATTPATKPPAAKPKPPPTARPAASKNSVTNLGF